MRRPTRTCVGCGRRVPQDTLERFAGVDGMLTGGRTLPGRGAYVCPGGSCFELAVARRAFARALRTQVSIPPNYNVRSDG